MMSKTLRVAFVGGPMYDGMYARLPQFEKQTGARVEIAFKGDHPSLNEHLENHGATYDLVSTHSKYSPSQANFLRPITELITKAELAAFTPSALELMSFGGQLWQLPRVIDCKILFYRTDVFTEHGALVPQTWTELADTAAKLHRQERCGFSFPGQGSGLFGHFYEILEAAGGSLFTPDLQPGFVSEAGIYAVEILTKLYREAAPPETVNFKFDQAAAQFISGKAAMTSDFPGSFHAYRSSKVVGDKFDVALYPTGPGGKLGVIRKSYSGGHSFALTSGTRDVPLALELLRFLTSEESQYAEAKLGSIVPRPGVMNRIRAEAPVGSLEERRLKCYEETMQHCMCIPPKFATYPLCEDALWESIQGAMTGKWDAKTAIQRAADAVRAVPK
jgi:multiple sugar transport system substrate-binding protein